MALPKNLRTIHPFPARMAPSLVWRELPGNQQPLRVLDPMAGSGTTLVTARLRGHHAIGFDRDPLAVTIAGAWVSNMDAEATEKKADEVLMRARDRANQLDEEEAFPTGADEKTKDFVRFWFDDTNRIQLTALSNSISRLHDDNLRRIMWCAMSRLIITKKRGVSLAMDVSHSRPHRKYQTAPITAFESFGRSVKHILKATPFANGERINPAATVEMADARHLPLEDESIDIVITSPPYLNAIDYLRGHKLSLVWMGHSTTDIRNLRSTNIGTEAGAKTNENDVGTEQVMRKMCDLDNLSDRHANMLRQYVRDTRVVLAEVHRVLVANGKAVFVVGNSTLQKSFIKNSRGIELLGTQIGLDLQNIRKRRLPENKRYLPPPGTRGAGKSLHKRMREEVILTFLKH